MKHLHRLVLGIILVFIYCGSYTIVYGTDESITQYVATAYYSPLPGQSHYITGSYQGDLRLNGKWVRTASGQWVFPWLLAAPSNYPFGTKIHFKWFGVGVVEDRWGAIVNAGERWYSYDRIDIWMGYGEEWLDRALRWWKREVTWKIVSSETSPSMDFWKNKFGYIGALQVSPEKSNIRDVERLQTLLKNTWNYSWVTDGKYKSVKKDFIDFQVKHGILSGYSDPSAWYFWPKTLRKIKSLYAKENRWEILIKEDEQDFYDSIGITHSAEYSLVLSLWNLNVGPDSNTDKITRLQRFMQEIAFYNGPIDWKYESIEWYLISMQKKLGLISNKDDWGAGYFGSKTKTALISYFDFKQTQKWNKYQLSHKEKEEILDLISNVKAIYRKKAKNGDIDYSTSVKILQTQLKKYLAKKDLSDKTRTKLEFIKRSI